MEASDQKLEKTIFTVIFIGFIIWSTLFIYRSSFIAIDGKRYFCLFDDAMISMRYAWNFSHGSGLVWNQGEYIQGYTNLLMTLLMSFATFAFDKSTAALFIQIAGSGFMLAIAYVTMQITNHMIPSEKHRSLIKVLSFFCALSYYPLVYWSLMGMETGLLTLLLLLGVLSALNYTTSMKPIFLLSMAGYMGLAYLTRNDSIIFVIIIWSYIIWEIPNIKTNRKSIYSLLGAIGIYFIFVIGQLLFQYLYYGELLPNTYTLKLTGMPFLTRIGNGVGFIVPFLKETVLILVISSMDLVFDFRKKKMLMFSLILSAIGYQIYVGGDPWTYWRMMSPCMPFLTILFINSIYAVIHSLSNTQAFDAYFLRNPIFPKRYITEVLATSFTLIGLFSMNMRFLPEASLLARPYQTINNKRNVNIAIVLDQLTTSDATVGVYWAGSIPYFIDRKAIDFLGKSDKYIAHLPPDISGAVAWNGMNSVPGHNKYDLNYSIKTLKPTYVQGFIRGTQDLSQWAKTKYVEVEYDGISLFLLKDSPFVLWSKINEP